MTHINKEKTFNQTIFQIIFIIRLNFLNDRAYKAKFVGDNNKYLQ